MYRLRGSLHEHIHLYIQTDKCARNRYTNIHMYDYTIHIYREDEEEGVTFL